MSLRSFAAALAALGLAACGHSPPTTLHALIAAPPASPPAAAYAGPPVRVDAVRLPPALDRLELLQETAPGRFTVQEFDRWAAQPSRLARQTLTEDLALRLPAGTLAPVGSGRPPVTAVSVEVLSFTSGPGGAVLTADWTHGCQPGDGLQRAYVQLQAPAAGGTPEALDALLGQLADRIAADLAAAPQPACPAPAATAPAAASGRG